MSNGKSRRGRRFKTPEHGPRTEHINMRTYPAFKLYVMKAAKRAGMDMSDFIEREVLRARDMV